MCLQLYQTALGLAYLHSEGIVHGDLHTGNLLVDENCCVRIADFGLSVLADASAYHTASENGGGTRRWIAPELHDADEFDRASRRPTRQSDVFSFGFTCTEVCRYRYRSHERRVLTPNLAVISFIQTMFHLLSFLRSK